MFRGISVVQLDDKGRMSIPTRYRRFLEQEAQSQLVMTIDTEACCLLLYPLFTWQEIERKIEALPSFNSAARRIQRLLIGHATEVELDGQNRILIPSLLRDYAGLQKSITLVGQGKKCEIWDEKQWNDAREIWLEKGLTAGGELPLDLESLSL